MIFLSFHYYFVDIKIVFGKVLKQVRKEKNISQEQLAFDSNLDRSYISKLETGVYQPSISTIFSISQALGVKMSDLIIATEKQLTK
jgi:transcriptional regulator with XRE-family HTH domain